MRNGCVAARMRGERFYGRRDGLVGLVGAGRAPRARHQFRRCGTLRAVAEAAPGPADHASGARFICRRCARWLYSALATSQALPVPQMLWIALRTLGRRRVGVAGARPHQCNLAEPRAQAVQSWRAGRRSDAVIANVPGFVLDLPARPRDSRLFYSVPRRQRCRNL